MSRRTSSRSTLTMVPSTMSPSLKYLMVSSMAARKSSSDPMSLIATCGAAERVGVMVIGGEEPSGGLGVVRERAGDRFTPHEREIVPGTGVEGERGTARSEPQADSWRTAQSIR